MARHAKPSLAASAWPFTGRQRELGLVAEAARDPAVSCVLLAGGEGVGKTRLARQALAALVDDGWETAETAVAGRSQMPLVVAPPPPLAVVDRSRSTPNPAASPSLGPRVGTDRPLALLVEDAHMLSERSAAWIADLIGAGECFVLLTSSEGSPAFDGFARLWRDGRIARVDVARLDGEELYSLLGSVLGGRVDGGARAELTRLAGGNLLILGKLLDAAVEGGSMSFDGCSWRLRGAAPISPYLHAHFGRRIDGLSPPERRLLEFVALAEPLEVGLLEALAGACATVASPATALVAISHDRRRAVARLTLPLFGRVLRADTPPLVARAVFRQLGNALAATGARRAGDRARLAVWRLDSGQTVDHELLTEGARQASRDHDPATAQRLARAASDWGAPWRGRSSAGQVSRRGTGPDELAATRASMVLRAGHAAQAAAMAGSVLSCSDPAWLDPLRPLAVATSALALLGRPDDALALAAGDDRGPPQADGTWLAAITATRVVWDALWFSGRLDEADAVARCGFEAVTGTGAEALRPLVAFHLGLVARARGQVRTALGWLEEASSGARHGDRFGLQVGILAAIAHCAAQAGEIGVARNALMEAEAAQHRMAMAMAMAMAEVRIRRSAAWVLASEGQLVRASKEAVVAADVAGEHGLRSLEAMALYDVARMGFARSIAARATRVTEGAQGALLGAIAAQIGALASGDGAGLEAAGARFEGLGMLLDAAEAASAAARGHLRSGDRAAAARSREQANQLVRQCEGARTPLMVEAAGPELITQREREVAELVASGLRSAEVAARLAISVRTVDSHLLRVYAKLGVGGRRELGQVFGSQHPPGPSPWAPELPQ